MPHLAKKQRHSSEDTAILQSEDDTTIAELAVTLGMGDEGAAVSNEGGTARVLPKLSGAESTTDV